jgi:hypothetical protein
MCEKEKLPTVDTSAGSVLERRYAPDNVLFSHGVVRIKHVNLVVHAEPQRRVTYECRSVSHSAYCVGL